MPVLMRLRHLVLLLLLLLAANLCADNLVMQRLDHIYLWSAPKDVNYSRTMMTNLNHRINDFQLKLGVYPEQNLYLIVLPDKKSFYRITHGKGKLLESSQAFYDPAQQVIYVRSPDQITPDSYDHVLMHEYIHWFLDQTLTRVPLWFHEGMATYFSGQFGFDTYYNYIRNRFMGSRISLLDMQDHYPSDRSLWEMFYLTSTFAVNYLQSHYGKAWNGFWDIAGYNYNQSFKSNIRKADFYSVFYSAFHMSVYAFSRDFDKAMRRYAWQFPFWGTNALIFALLPFILLLAWIRMRRKLHAPEHPDTSPPAPYSWKHKNLKLTRNHRPKLTRRREIPHED